MGRRDFYTAEAAPGVKWGVACLVFTCFSSFLEYLCAHAHRKVEVSSQRVGAGSFLPPSGTELRSAGWAARALTY